MNCPPYTFSPSCLIMRTMAYARCLDVASAPSEFCERKKMGEIILPWGSFLEQGGEGYKVPSEFPPHRGIPDSPSAEGRSTAESMSHRHAAYPATAIRCRHFCPRQPAQRSTHHFPRGYEIATPKSSLVSNLPRNRSPLKIDRFHTYTGAGLSTGAYW